LNRHWEILAIIIISSFVLLAKAAQLQLFNQKYKRLAQNNTLDQQVLYPSRGLLYDRNGDLIVYNKPVYNIEAIYKKIDSEMDTTLFCELLDIDKATFENNLNKDWSSAKFHKSLPFVFLNRVKPELFARFQEHSFQFPGFKTKVRSIRVYPHTNAAHVLGYLGEVNQKVINQSNGIYVAGDYIGQSGLEKYYEPILRGKKGIKHVIKDNLGREVDSFDEGQMDVSALPGVDIHTSLDLPLQAYGELLMANKRGSIVAIEPATGEILCSVSSPTYDPNLLNLDEDRGKTFANLLADDVNKPFLDRSVLAKYPPGSIFKPILSLIALQEEIVSPYKSVSCPGYYEYNTFQYKCHDHPHPGSITTALVNSCNSYFFDMIREVLEVESYNNPSAGLKLLDSYLTMFGLGEKLGIDNSFENAGFIPTPEYYNQLYAGEVNGWRATYVMSIGIGQGELELTTLQMANLAAIIANKGSYYIPHFAKGFSDKNIYQETRFREAKYAGVAAEHYDIIIKGLTQVVEYGTGYNAKTPGISIAGKTGTSQNSQGEDHSVFFAFAPVDNPQIAIAVYVENAGFGGVLAAPISGLMIEKYLNKEIMPFSKRKEEKILNTILIEGVEVNDDLKAELSDLILEDDNS